MTTSDNLVPGTAYDAPPPARVVIVGGGIAGLAAAYRLTRCCPGVKITLVERERRLGGKILTERVDDLLIEAGPDSFLGVKPRGVGLVTELGLADRLHGPTPRRHRAFVPRGGVLHPLPEGLSGLVPSRLAPIFRSGLLTPAGKARFAADLILPARRGGGDESLAAFVRRRLGGDAYDHLVEPLMAGIYAGDGDRLSLAATFPHLRAAELARGSLIRGVLATRSAALSLPSARPAFLTLIGGLGELVRALTEQLVSSGVEIRAGTAATRIQRRPIEEGAKYTIELADGQRLTAEAIIVAAPADAAGNLVSELDAELTAELRGIPHGSTAIVHLAFRRDQVAHPLDGHGYVIPRIEHRPALAATFVSEKWPGRAPADRVLLRVFLGRFGQAEVLSCSEPELIALARTEVAETLGITGVPDFTLAHRWPGGMPQYVLGHLERLHRIDAGVNRHPGLALAGNAYRGVGIPDVIASGEAAAVAVSACLIEAAGSRRAPGRRTGSDAEASAPAHRGSRSPRDQ